MNLSRGTPAPGTQVVRQAGSTKVFGEQQQAHVAESPRPVKDVQRQEGVLMMGRQHAPSTATTPAQPSSTISLPVKNNMILAEMLGVLQNFNQEVERELGMQAKTPSLAQQQQSLLEPVPDAGPQK